MDSEPNPRHLSELFTDLLYSPAPIRDRVNRFKRDIDSLYRELTRGGTIQLNLISQFLGLCFPHEHYVYKYTEFRKATAYFEYGIELLDTSAGGTYEYFQRFCCEIKSAMEEAGLQDVDFIDVQTFVFREDWHSPTDLEQEKDEFERETTKLASLSIGELLERVKKPERIPARTVRRIYYGRDPNIAAIVKKDAQGICDLCGKEAPFRNRAGQPYLECHHVIYLAGGGTDEIDNCVALCPNCHTKMHILNLEPDRKKLLDAARERCEKLGLVRM